MASRAHVGGVGVVRAACWRWRKAGHMPRSEVRRADRLLAADVPKNHLRRCHGMPVRPVRPRGAPAIRIQPGPPGRRPGGGQRLPVRVPLPSTLLTYGQPGDQLLLIWRLSVDTPGQVSPSFQ